ncbi:hypothetical protein N9869_01695 [Algibacter sp.]|nr:hypothetical protein [Algibacter sp.]MDB4274016.1 hypothetical protein [Algibacter sp.]
MAIEKGLSPAPMGIQEEALGAEALEIEIVNPDMVTLDDGSVEVTIIPGDDNEKGGFNANIADDMEEDELSMLADDLIDLVDSDFDSRKDWADTFVKGLDVLGFKYEERTEPWEGACGVYSTVLAEAAIRFQAETMSETFPAAGPVRTKLLGEETKEKDEAAARVKADMNYELTENMVEYRPEHERLLYSLGLAGSSFKKVYYDPNLGRQVALYIPAEDVVVPYGASHIETAERVTHVMRKTKNEMKKLQANKFYRELDLGEPQAFHTDIEERKAEEGGYSLTDDDRYTLYEVHADLVIEGVDDSDDEIAKPYVVTIERGSNEILAIRRNWNPDDKLKLKRQHFVHYVYVPGFGFYGLGLIHIIGGYARAGTSLIRQLVDAGTLSNLPGGLKSRGLRIKGDDTPITPGEFKDVDVPSGSIRDNIMPLPYKEPSQTLLALLNQITTEGRRLGAISDMNISDMSANAPVGTTLALLERTLKPMAAVQARVHYAMKQEFKLLKTLLAEYAPAEYSYQPLRGEVGARQADYALVEVIPVSDPNSSTMAQRVVQYQAVLQMSQSAPQIYDLPQLHRQMIEVLGVKNADKLVPIKEDMRPADPVSENMNALVGKPIKAFIYQDHDAHIQTHTAFMKDPAVAQMIGQNPQANQIMASLQAHIAEHLGFNYRKQMEERLGAPLPPPNEELDEDVEIQLARAVAEAGKQLTQAHQQQAAQQQAQQKAQDPVVQMQQAELQLKAQEVQRKVKKDADDVEIKKAQLQLKAANDKEQLKLDKTEMMLEAGKQKVKLQDDKQDKADKRNLEILKTMK